MFASIFRSVNKAQRAWNWHGCSRFVSPFVKRSSFLFTFTVTGFVVAKRIFKYSPMENIRLKNGFMAFSAILLRCSSCLWLNKYQFFCCCCCIHLWRKIQHNFSFWRCYHSFLYCIKALDNPECELKFWIFFLCYFFFAQHLKALDIFLQQSGQPD